MRIKQANENTESDHSALKQKIGDFYHYDVALYYMIDNSDWFYCDLEKNGDISLTNNLNEIILSIEVKYHDKPIELKDNVEELWKTIYNFYNDSDKYMDTTKLILYTASTISKNNTLYNWNSLSSQQKINLLKEASKNKQGEVYKTIKKFYDKIFQNEKKLHGVLSKFDIYANQAYYTEHKKNIKRNAYFRIFDSEKKQLISINNLLEIIHSSFKDVNTWRISSSDFDKKLKEVSANAQDIIVRVDEDINIEIDEGLYKDSNFLDKLREITKDDMTINFAIEDYAKTVYELEMRMNFLSEFDYHKKIDSYENNLIREYHITKSSITPNPANIIEQSKNFYTQIQKLHKVPFIGKTFNDKTTFFQRGYYHILADDDENEKKIIHWHLGKK